MTTIGLETSSVQNIICDIVKTNKIRRFACELGYVKSINGDEDRMSDLRTILSSYEKNKEPLKEKSTISGHVNNEAMKKHF